MPAWSVHWAQRLDGTLTLLVNGNGSGNVEAAVGDGGGSVTLSDPAGIPRPPVTLPLFAAVAPAASVRQEGSATLVALAPAVPGDVWPSLIKVGVARGDVDAVVSNDWSRWVDRDDDMAAGAEDPGTYMDLDVPEGMQDFSQFYWTLLSL